MAFSELPISYCANVHPGKSFDDVRDGLERYTAELRRRLGCTQAVGLWMAASAVEEATAAAAPVDDLAGWLREHDLLCYTMNAFPLGNFHARRVKQQVFLPDWTSEDRYDFTCRVARILTRLLPEGIEGSISTSPCAFKALHPPGRGPDVYFERLIAAASYLADIHSRTGRLIRLAIEPEPGCVLETTSEVVEFFHALWAHVAGRPEQDAVGEHLGVCYDVCHQSVEHESVTESLGELERAGIRIVKVHITCALELADPRDAEARQQLAQFVEERYLHQTFARAADGHLLRLADLTVEHASDPPEEWLEAGSWRVHFHVPVHRERLGLLHTTRSQLVEALRRVAQLDYAPHLEIETYTWNILPTEQSRSGSSRPGRRFAGRSPEHHRAVGVAEVREHRTVCTTS